MIQILRKQILQLRLKISWMNEKMSPEILENDDDITENSLALIQAMETNLKRHRQKDSTIKEMYYQLVYFSMIIYSILGY